MIKLGLPEPDGCRDEAHGLLSDIIDKRIRHP